MAQEFIAGETLHGLAARHGVSRNLICVWVMKFEAGAFDEDAEAADLLQEYEAKIAALERMVGRQALEIEFLKGAPKNAPRPHDHRATASPTFGIAKILKKLQIHPRQGCHPVDVGLYAAISGAMFGLALGTMIGAAAAQQQQTQQQVPLSGLPSFPSRPLAR
jgi:transposase-like protein